MPPRNAEMAALGFEEVVESSETPLQNVEMSGDDSELAAKGYEAPPQN